MWDLTYYIDRTPYDGSCQFVHDKLAPYKKPVLEEMPVYDMKDWELGLLQAKRYLTDDEFKLLENYKPELTIREMQQLMYTTAYVSMAFMAFNITHFIMEGSLIGAWRHHFLTPWDDDVDMLFDASQWPMAKKIVTCLPDIQLDMGSDYMWKAFHKDSELWLGESWIKFPFVDLFPYKYDSDHVWPLTIWLKADTLMFTKYALPPAKGVFGGWPVMIPHKTGPALDFMYGKVLSDCYSRTFKRREREMIPRDKRYHFPCRLLKNIFPFVRRTKIDRKTNTVLEERVHRGKVLSSFNTTFHGSYE